MSECCVNTCFVCGRNDADLIVCKIDFLCYFIFCSLALSTILENTALLGDIVLRLPDVAHELLDGNDEWKQLTQWAVAFTNDTHIFIDKDQQLISMVGFPTCMYLYTDCMICDPLLSLIL